jgi:HK97 family phage portal protein
MTLRSAAATLLEGIRDPGLIGLELRGDPLNNPAVPLSAAGFLTWATSGEPTASGEQVTLSTALQQITVYACARVISESLSSLPARIWERVGKARREASDLPVGYLVGVEPNPEMSAVTFWDALTGALALTGNCYAEIQRDKGGRPVALWPLHPQITTPKRDSKGNLYYETSSGMPSGRKRVIDPDNMFHVPLFCFDGLKGLSPIGLARQGIGLARASEKFGARFFGNGAKPGGVLSLVSGGDPDDPQMKNVKTTWERTQGGENQGRTAVLPGDWKYTPIGISPEDSQFLETRQFQRSEIAAMMRVPPHKVGDQTQQSKANYEQAELSFVTDTLRPYLARYEAEAARKLFPALGRNAGKFFLEFDVSERLRGDFKTMMDGFAIGKQWGFYSTNVVLEKLGENPIGPEGDVYLVPVNMQNAERLLDTDSIQDQPIPNENDSDTASPALANSAPAAGEDDEEHILQRYSLAYMRMFHDSFGRLWARDKRDLRTISSIFDPLFLSIADHCMEELRASFGEFVSAESALKHARSAIEGMARRAMHWTQADDSAAIEKSEFLRAVRSIYINLSRDAAAAKAEAMLRGGKA